MLTLLALIVAIVLQFIGAIVALSLTKRTKYSLSWILISIGFLIMAIQRFFEFIPYIWRGWEKDVAAINTWLGIITSILVAIGLILIRKIFEFLKKAEKSRVESEKRVLNAIIQTEERERRRLAKDLHDGLGPLLSTVKMAFSALTKGNSDKNNELIKNTDLVITEAIKSLKEISNNLSPHVLDNFGLASAIKSFSSKISSTKTIGIVFNSNMFEHRLDYNTEVVLYRIVCELINNTIKHAQANNIDINLNRHNHILSLVYSDDGKGFDVDKVLFSQGEGMGYSNIISRIKTIKGIINVESSDEKGTKVIIIVNL